ncbi:MAG: bifunctional diaminohydroxyphosphoribosylaminopyrimidine deaminase/5-amino-6-(5-phosphoribosylamino)uracil reductase RibD [bacterium]|nr:bifunctional diaminohydroxyphosphoribosylaminopyrimidine deaminase/5-amino-6-(5-phosphoribosylamino)uracil reductase RibD [bacterium]
MSDANGDTKWMSRALELAERGGFAVQPNPQVGAVIVRDDRIIGEGWHQAVGRPHAEREALAACTEDPAGATIYITLEPCHCHGRTGPCTEAILEAGISRVVYALEDPNPAEAGRSHRLLSDAGLQVEGGLMHEKSASLNEMYVHRQKTGRPWILLKSAATLNGMLARADGSSRWITGEESRYHVHNLRASVAAVAVGGETAMQDRPRLDLRHLGELAPQRLPRPVVFDGSPVRCPIDLDWRGRSPLLLTPPDADTAPFAGRGWSCHKIKHGADGHLDLQQALQLLAAEGLNSILVEGGGRLTTAFLNAGLWERWELFLAPKLFPADGRPLWTMLAERQDLLIEAVEQVGDDLRVIIKPKRRGNDAGQRGEV